MKVSAAKIQVRFSDLDIMGHVNNSVYLSYFEYARVHYFGQLLGTDWNWKTDGVLLVRNEVEYLRPVLLNDIPEVTVYTEEIGTKSFTLRYEIHVNDTLTTKGLSVLVCYNAQTNQTIAVPEKMKEALLSLKKV